MEKIFENVGGNQFREIPTEKHGRKLTFVNGEPAKCGCTIKILDGAWPAVDVVSITLCKTHSG